MLIARDPFMAIGTKTIAERQELSGATHFSPINNHSRREFLTAAAPGTETSRARCQRLVSNGVIEQLQLKQLHTNTEFNRTPQLI